MKAKEQKRIVREGYDRPSYAYRPDDTPDDYERYADWVEILADHVPDGSPVLDIGCGCGLPATKLLATRFDVTGVDFSRVQIERARRLVPRAHFLCADVQALAFDPETFDAIVSFYTIIHMPLEEQPALFMNLTRWLRPSGILMAIVGHRAWTGTEESYLDVEGGLMAWSHADEDTYVRWIEGSGLHVHWLEFVPEGESGHTLVFAQKPAVEVAS
ncbi:MAG: class I SAM-dependent methyltransferase [Candidatus Bipolaricaulota bacterium]|nr:MAG: class I SAM-dependent methyltransferase [Candidatus Bipolaricaulota bacterium]